MSYDMRVYKLVELFLSEVPEKNTAKNRHLLAQHIQDEIEDWTLFMLLPDSLGADALADDRKFSVPLVRLSRCEVRDHINYRKNDV